ncbi:MFS transporter [Phyllobacterium sp. 21LDTY02-6]|jgi:MFS family permease|uniref:MFS transporter n=1 Tax=unclassified Phyllobacterium TaxID=2638441 RepID=UPI00202191C4|nr:MULTISPECIES: MFS transporter [unclassified Phyllobacterium]MCO4319601.1 MFS transporter [Phyllobacterium sp. 21LDTY02-6]MCX8280345.1 MFS transporter [Phyllobacterium sp. 0TCS1.6C]MCX8295206.1 MFS transporter [Phyllobacterium sp. 0TCS1.6A]
MSGYIRATAIVVLTAAIFGLTYGLSAPLIALELAEAGYSEGFIGANGAMYAIGVLLAAPYLPRLAQRLGFPALAKGALLASSGLLVLFPLAPFLWLWFPLRAALGAASETLFVVSETWLNQLAAQKNRGTTMAIYVTALSCGTALGPAILTLVGRQQSLAFLIGAAIAVVACVILFVGRPAATAPAREETGNPFRYLKLVPVAVASSALNAALEAAGLTLLPLYAIRLGWTEDSATLLLTVLLIGAITLQLPIGWLADRLPRQTVLIALSVISAIGALVWPIAFSNPWLAYPLLYVWGGAFVGIYTTTIAMLGDAYKDNELLGIYALLSIFWGIGALLGPLIGGLAMEVSPHGLPVFAAVICAGFALFSACRQKQGKPGPAQTSGTIGGKGR